MTRIDPRTAHYAAFYGLEQVAHDAPLGIVIGNCQAESLRIMLDGRDIRTVRIPPVHELTDDDIPHLHRLLGRAEYVVSQPVRHGYRGLPLGTDQVAERLGSAAVLCMVPVIRFAGLYPYHGIVRPPSDPSLVPPLVAYHDLRVLAEAGGLIEYDDLIEYNGMKSDLTTEQVLAVAEMSLHELRRREQEHGCVVISDVFLTPTWGHMRTINHPGNIVFQIMSDRVRASLELAPSRTFQEGELLSEVQAPRERLVMQAYGLADVPTKEWTVSGRRLTTESVRQAHLQFYREHPDAVAAGLDRHEAALRILALL